MAALAAAGPARASSLDQLVNGSTGDLVWTDPAQPSFPFHYRLWRPPNVVAGQKYPLIVFLHGAGAQGTDNVVPLYSLIDTTLFDLATIAQRRFFVAAPQISDPNAGWGPNNDRTIQWPTHSVVKFTDFLVAGNPIDTDRLYLVGASMGGRGTWGVIGEYPDKYAAAAPCSGPADLANAPKLVAAGIPIWGCQSFHDPTNPPCGPRTVGAQVYNARDMFRALEAAGAAIVYTEGTPPQACPGTPPQIQQRNLPRVTDRYAYTEYDWDSHYCWQRLWNDARFIDWLFTQRKAAAPADAGVAPDAGVAADAAAGGAGGNGAGAGGATGGGGSGGAAAGGASGGAGGDGAGGGDAGGTGAGGSGGAPAEETAAGCGCRVGAASAGPPAGSVLLALLAVAIGGAWRRRRSRRR